MPVALSASCTAWVSLPLDLEIPEADRPAFKVRFLSERQLRELDALKPDEFDAVTPPAKGAEVVISVDTDRWRSKLAPILAPYVVGTRNMGESKSGMEALDDLVLGELEDLAAALLKNSRLGYHELKKSRSQPVSGAAVSAPSAAAAPAATPPTT